MTGEVPKHAYPIRAWADANGISHTTCYAEIASGRLKTFKIGRLRYISDEASRKYFSALERKGA